MIQDIQNGVGDDVYSYSYDGVRQHKWHAETASDYGVGITWRKGDRIGCILSYTESGVDIGYRLNNIWLGKAFSITGTAWDDLKKSMGSEDTRPGDVGLELYAVISSEVEEVYALHLGQSITESDDSSSNSSNISGGGSSKAHSLYKYPLVKEELNAELHVTPPLTSLLDANIHVAEPIPLTPLTDLEDGIKYPTSHSLEAFGLEYLKYELSRRGLKCGGTLQQRAERLFSVRHMKEQDIPIKLKK